MANRIKAATPRHEAAKKRRRHPKSGQFVRQSGNGHGMSPQYSTPIGVSPLLTRTLRPQAAFRWILPNVAAITPQYIETVMRGALAGNHVQQWELFSLMFDSWPALLSCWSELRFGVIGKKIVFEAAHEEDEAPTPDALERMRVVSGALLSMHPEADRDDNAMEGLVSDILDAWLRGVTVLEVIWEIRELQGLGTFWCPQSTFWVHPVCYGFNADGVLGLRTVEQPYQPGGIQPNRNYGVPTPYPYSYLSAQPQPAVLQPFPENKFLIGIHKAVPGTALGGAMLRSLAWWWVASGYCADWLLNLAQLFGIPFRFANYDPNAPDKTINSINEMLQNMGTNPWASFPTGTTLEFKEVGGGRNAEYSPQGTLMDRADRYVREVVLGQTMTGNTMTSGKGGQAFGVVEKDVKQERIDAAGKYACEVINRQLIRSILLLNYGDDSNAPRMRLLEENEGQFVDAQRDQILVKMGLPMGVDFLRKKYGTPEPAQGEELLEQPQLMPNPFGDGQQQDGAPKQLNEDQPGPDAVASASGAYAPGHPFYGNQFRLGDYVETPHGKGMIVANAPDHAYVSHDNGQIQRVMHSDMRKISRKFPSITHSAENERRLLQNQGIQTKDEPPQVINVHVESAAAPTTKTFTIKRSDGTVVEGEIQSKKVVTIKGNEGEIESQENG